MVTELTELLLSELPSKKLFPKLMPPVLPVFVEVELAPLFVDDEEDETEVPKLFDPSNPPSQPPCTVKLIWPLLKLLLRLPIPCIARHEYLLRRATIKSWEDSRSS